MNVLITHTIWCACHLFDFITSVSLLGDSFAKAKRPTTVEFLPFHEPLFDEQQLMQMGECYGTHQDDLARCLPTRPDGQLLGQFAKGFKKDAVCVRTCLSPCAFRSTTF